MNSVARQIGAALGVSVVVAIIGTPTPATAYAVFHDAWTFGAVCLFVAGLGCLLVGHVKLGEVPAPGQVPAPGWAAPGGAAPGEVARGNVARAVLAETEPQRALRAPRPRPQRVIALDASVRGIEFCRKLVTAYNVHVFDSLATGRGRSAKRDPRRKKNQSRTEAVVALTWAASQGDLTEVRALVAAGIEPGTADYDGRTPLHLAAAEGQPEVVSYLLALGADPTPHGSLGWHPAIRCRSQRPHPDRGVAPPARRRQGPPSPSRRQARGSSGMSDNDVAGGRVVAVLLADGWHRIVPGSFRVGPLSFEAEAGPGTPGFRFEEADAGRPYQPTVLAGPLGSIIAVRQVTPACTAHRRPGPGPGRARRSAGGSRRTVASSCGPCSSREIKAKRDEHVRRGRQTGLRQPARTGGPTPPAGTPTRSCSSRTATSGPPGPRSRRPS